MERLDERDLKPARVSGYLFDFGDDWYHRVQVDRIEEAILTANYPVSSGGWANLRRGIAANGGCVVWKPCQTRGKNAKSPSRNANEPPPKSRRGASESGSS